MTDPPQPKKKVRLANYGNLTRQQTVWRWEYPNAHIKPNFQYDTDQKHFHRDIMGRKKEKWTSDDRYLSYYDGRAKPLCVQTTDDVYRAANNSTYMRTFMRNTSPFMLRVARWPISKPNKTPRLWHTDTTHRSLRLHQCTNTSFRLLACGCQMDSIDMCSHRDGKSRSTPST